METKRCPHCETVKGISMFSANAARSDKLQGICKECKKEYDRKHHHKNKKSIYAYKVLEKARRHAFLLDYLRSHPCADCGEPDPVVLDFDHVRGLKILPVSVMANQVWSMDSIELEIAKCDVRCANCHRRATAKRHGNWYKNRQH